MNASMANRNGLLFSSSNAKIVKGSCALGSCMGISPSRLASVSSDHIHGGRARIFAAGGL